MFESFKNHPLTKDVLKAKDAVKDFNHDVSEELSHTVGNWSTKLLGGIKWVKDKVVDHFALEDEKLRQGIEEAGGSDALSSEPKIDRTDWV